jgi:broad specificity phosphatase PhoE
MKKAALYVHGRIVVGFNHGDAFGKLTEIEQHEFIISGFYDPETEEFDSDSTDDHFYDKEMILVRHANVQDRSDPDTGISEFGAQQIEKLGSFLLENVKIKDYIFLTSPLLRCLQTAQILHQKIDVPIEVCPGVMETPEESFCLKNHKDKFSDFDWPTSHNWDLSPESPEVFLSRIRQTLQGLPHKAIIVTHFGTIFNLARLASCDNKAKEMLNQGIPPASAIEIDKKKMERLEYEDVS